MTLRLKCHYCGKVFVTGEDAIGKLGKCPSCKRVSEVPDSTIRFRCTNCQRVLSGQRHMVGMQAKCDTCDTWVTIPRPVISFACRCGRVVTAPEDKAGERGRCPQCGSTIQIPRVFRKCSDGENKLDHERQSGDSEADGDTTPPRTAEGRPSEDEIVEWVNSKERATTSFKYGFREEVPPVPEEEPRRKRKKQESDSIVLKCRKCGERYVLGENAVVSSMRMVAAHMRASGGVIAGTSSSPDLVDHGVLSLDPELRALHDADLRFLKEARSKKRKLTWSCAKCQHDQEYPW